MDVGLFFIMKGIYKMGLDLYLYKLTKPRRELPRPTQSLEVMASWE